MWSNVELGLVFVVISGRHVLPQHTKGLWQLRPAHPAAPPEVGRLSSGFLSLALRLQTGCQQIKSKPDESDASTSNRTNGKLLLEIRLRI